MRRRLSSGARRFIQEASPRSASVRARPPKGGGVDVTRRRLSSGARRDQRPSARDPPPSRPQVLALDSLPIDPRSGLLWWQVRTVGGARDVVVCRRDGAARFSRASFARSSRRPGPVGPAAASRLPRPSRSCRRRGRPDGRPQPKPVRTQTHIARRGRRPPARACSTLSSSTVSTSTAIPAARGRSPRCAHDDASHEGPDDGSLPSTVRSNVSIRTPFHRPSRVVTRSRAAVVLRVVMQPTLGSKKR